MSTAPRALWRLCGQPFAVRNRWRRQRADDDWRRESPPMREQQEIAQRGSPKEQIAQANAALEKECEE